MTAEQKTTNKQEQSLQRSRYLGGEISHSQYYGWLSDFIGLSDGMIPVSNERVKASKDPHLNDIPLSTWDAMHGIVQQAAFSAGLPWSQSDTVCCLKEMARRRAATTD